MHAPTHVAGTLAHCTYTYTSHVQLDVARTRRTYSYTSHVHLHVAHTLIRRTCSYTSHLHVARTPTRRTYTYTSHLHVARTLTRDHVENWTILSSLHVQIIKNYYSKSTGSTIAQEKNLAKMLTDHQIVPQKKLAAELRREDSLVT